MFACAVFAAALSATNGRAQNAKPMVVVPREQARWVPIDSTRPNGAAMAVLWGEPTTGPSAFLLRLVKGAGRLHVHTSDYHLVVLEGTMTHWGMGVRQTDAPRLAPGSFWFQPGNEPHGDACLSEVCVMYVQFAGKRDGRLADAPPGAQRERGQAPRHTPR